MEEVINQELTIIDNSIDVFRGGSALLVSHRHRAAQALKIAGDIVEQWKAAEGIEDLEARKQALAAVDSRSNDFLAKCNVRVKEMEDARKAITQLMDAIKKMFIEEEAKVDIKKSTLLSDIQQHRNAYAAWQKAQEERIRREAEEKAALQKERVDLVASLKNAIAKGLLDMLAQKKTRVTETFNKITLETFEGKSANLASMSCEFPRELINSIHYPTPSFFRHTVEQVTQIKKEVFTTYDYSSFANEYQRQMGELRQSLIDRLPAKKEELEQIAEAQRKAEEARKAAEEAKNKKVREEALARQKQLQEEEKRLAEEKSRREQEEADRLRLQAEAAAKTEAEKLEMEKAAGQAAAMFEQVEEVTQVSQGSPSTRSGYNIIVKHPAGWVEIFQFWFTKEGMNASTEEIAKKSLGQMKTFAEGYAKKHSEKIDSKYLVYEEVTKAINKKSK